MAAAATTAAALDGGSQRSISPVKEFFPQWDTSTQQDLNEAASPSSANNMPPSSADDGSSVVSAATASQESHRSSAGGVRLRELVTFRPGLTAQLVGATILRRDDGHHDSARATFALRYHDPATGLQTVAERVPTLKFYRKGQMERRRLRLSEVVDARINATEYMEGRVVEVLDDDAYQIEFAGGGGSAVVDRHLIFAQRSEGSTAARREKR